jgi:hypothetical protein
MRSSGLAIGGDFAPARLVLADHLRAGVPFDVAWPCAIEAVTPNDRRVLRETGAAWKAEYEGRNSYGGNLLAALTAMLDNDAVQRGDRALA